MTARVLRGIGANLYGQAVTVVAQIGAVPVLLRAWGPQGLGHWLTLVAATSVLSLVDCGLMVATGNAATMAAGRGDLAEAADLLRRLMQLVLGLAAGFGLLLVLAEPVYPTFGVLADQQNRVAITALGLAALAGLALGTVELGYRACGRYARGMAQTSTVRLVETCAVMLIASMGGTAASAAVALLGVRTGGAAVTMVLLGRQEPWLRRRPTRKQTARLGSLVHPALAALAIPAALACLLQGTTVVAGVVIPAEAVAAFVATRTLTRLLVQALGLVTHALMPEYALAAGRGDARRLADLRRVNLAAGAVLLVPGWGFLILLGPWLMDRWTGGSVQIDPLAFDLLASAAVAHGVWLSASNLLLAVNRQAEFAVRTLVVASLTCAAAAPLGLVWGLRGMALASLAGEFTMVAILFPTHLAAASQRGGVAATALGR